MLQVIQRVSLEAVVVGDNPLVGRAKGAGGMTEPLPGASVEVDGVEVATHRLGQGALGIEHLDLGVASQTEARL